MINWDKDTTVADPGKHRVVLSNIILVLLVLASVCGFFATDATADGFSLPAPGGGWHGPAVVRSIGSPFIYRFQDVPGGGYGEYAEYGLWAYRRIDGCSPVRQRVRTEDGWLTRLVQICN
jgi:hypothetical protein